MDRYTARQFEKIRVRTEFDDIVSHFEQEACEEARKVEREEHERARQACAQARKRDLRAYGITLIGLVALVFLGNFAATAARNGLYAAAIILVLLGICLAGRAVLRADRISRSD